MPISGYFDTPFGSAGDLTPVPDAVQTDGTISYSQGWGILYNTPVGSGGQNVARGTMNQVLYDITSAVQKYQQNTIAPFITTAMNGGAPYSYNQYALVLYSGVAYQSLVNANTDTPPSPKWARMDYRIKLLANTTYYVSPTGNDSTGNGTVGAQWLTIQHAINYINNVDLNGFTATIQLADGTYSAFSVTSSWVGGNISNVIINGNNSTPSNVVITSGSGATGLAQFFGCGFAIQNLELTNTTASIGSSSCLSATDGAEIYFSNIIFGACTGSHIAPNNGALIRCNGNYSITGSSDTHVNHTINGIFICIGNTVTLTGTPAFGTAFVKNLGASAEIVSTTFSGSATGKRYDVSGNGLINTAGGGATYLPGSVTGTTATGGQYI